MGRLSAPARWARNRLTGARSRLRPAGKWLIGQARRLRFYQFALLATLAALVLAAMLPVPTAMTTLVARTEVLSYAPTNAALAPVILTNARILDSAGLPQACLPQVELVPAGAEPVSVDLSRDPSSPGQLNLALKGEWNWSDPGGGFGMLRGDTLLRLTRDSTDCRAQAHIRIPVSGLILVGSESGDSPLKMMGGTVRVYGRSLSQLDFLSLRGEGTGRRGGTVYSASEIVLPADTRIGTTLRSGREDEPSNEARWIGFADVELDEPQPGFDIQLATGDPSVGIVMPGSAGANPDNLSITLFAQLGGDPGMQRLAGLFAILIALLAIVAQRWPARSGGA
jgi:hypothetical protein